MKYQSQNIYFKNIPAPPPLGFNGSPLTAYLKNKQLLNCTVIGKQLLNYTVIGLLLLLALYEEVSAMQSQTAVTTYFTSKQLLLFIFE